jgi:hypothetical protein
LDSVAREMGLVAEIALGAQSLHDFALQWRERLRPALGFDHRVLGRDSLADRYQEYKAVVGDTALLAEAFAG